MTNNERTRVRVPFRACRKIAGRQIFLIDSLQHGEIAAVGGGKYRPRFQRKLMAIKNTTAQALCLCGTKPTGDSTWRKLLL